MAVSQRDAAEKATSDAMSQRDAGVRGRATAEVAQADALAQQKVAHSRELRASAVAQLKVDPELSLLLGLEAVKVSHTTQAEDALTQALLESHV